MYRIFILSLLAIVSTTFALEPSSVILRATEIRWDSLVLEWLPLEGATSYKVFYDEENLINPKVPEPILESPATDKTSIELQKMMDGTEYYFVVQWFDAKGVKVGQTLPLHAKTLRVPLFVLKDSKTLDDQNISLTFSHPIDIKKTIIEIVNSETQKPRTIKEMTLSQDDLRVVNIRLEGKMAANVSHDILLKKVTNTSWTEMMPESRKTSKIMYSLEPAITDISLESSGPSDIVETKKETVEIPVQPDMLPEKPLQDEKIPDGENIDVVAWAVHESEEPQKTPVVIDTLPQTGTSIFIILFVALIFWGVLAHKKQTSI